MNNIFQILLILFVFSNFSMIRGAEIIVKRGNQSTELESKTIRGIEYVSIEKLSEILDANFYFNRSKQKAEIKFIDYNLKFTANNQFVILTDRKSNQHQIFQLPISAKNIDDEIYIPIVYSAKYLGYASKLSAYYSSPSRTLTIDNKSLNTEEIVTWNKKLINRSSIKYDVFDARIENKSNGTLLRLATKRKIRKPTSSINNNTLYIFFSDITIDKNEITSVKQKGFIRGINVKHINGNPQLEIKLREGFDKHEIFYDEDIGEILVSIHNKYLKDEVSALEEADKWNFEVVVLDPGHGGKDPGAIGLNGIKEKDINLAIAKELGTLIESNLSDIKVIYTRNDDRFIELYRRGQIANENKGNLFISIHCNSAARKPGNANGFEVYLLRPGKTKEAIDIAEFENSVISLEDDPSRYKELNDENFILVSMKHASNMRYAETFADMLNTEWIKGSGIKSRGIKQAGFYVLVGASMPGVLIESGFISNRNDANYLSSKSGQKEIAKSILNAILKYKNYYESSINSELNK